MYRWTSRFLLVLLLVSVFAPVGLAISAPTPHACCVRKPLHDHHRGSPAQIAAVDCCRHDCCRSVSPTHWAEFRPALRAECEAASTGLAAALASADPAINVSRSHSGRAPPSFLLG